MSQARRGLQGNPLDAVIPDLRSNVKRSMIGSQPETPTSSKIHGVERTPTPRLMRRRFTAHVRDDVIERAKNAVYWTPGLTMAELVERGIERILAELEKKNGKVFENRRAENKGGRPIT